MALITENLGRFAAENQFLAYFTIYAATIFLGNISAFAGLWAALRGALGPHGLPLVIVTILLAEASGDIIWYSVGRGLRDTRFGNFVRNKFASQHEKIESSLQKSGASWIFLSKFLYASAFPVIFTVGWSGAEFKKFFKVSILSVLFWVPVLTAVSYALVSTLSPLEATDIFRRVEILFIAGLALFILIDYFLMRFLKKLFNGVKFFGGGLMNGAGGSEEEKTEE